MTLTLSDLFKQAVGSYQAGHFDKAEALCGAILRAKPGHFDALHLFAAVQSRLGRLQQALASYDKAVAVNPDSAEALHNRGITLQQLNRLGEALASYDKALAIKPDFAQALINRGITLKHLKRFEDALASYDKALAIKPDYADALNNRGAALRDLKRFEDALASYDKALSIKPDYAEALNNRGNILRDLTRLEEALASYDKALAIKPDYADALNNRGIALRDLNRCEEALASYDKALAINPGYAEVLNGRGVALRELKRFEEALASYDRALAIKPDYAEALINRGTALRDLKRFEEGLASYDNVLAIQPDYVEVLNNRGATLRDLKRFEEALASYEKALAIKPDYSEAWSNRGIALQDFKRYGEALASYDRALAIKPDYIEALINRGTALQELKRSDDALASYDRALAIKPDYAEALNNRGNALRNLKRFEEALASYDRALAIKPDYAEALNNRGNALRDLRRFEEALASFDKALAIDPYHLHAFAGAAECALALCDWKRIAQIEEELRDGIAAKRSVVDPFTLLGYSGDPSLHRICAENYVRESLPTLPSPVGKRQRNQSEKIRIGYLSAKFRLHPGASLIAELIEIHDRSHFEIIGLSLGHDDRSDMRARLMRGFDVFHDLRGMSDQQAAEHLSRLAVDIAVDLTGHNRDARPGILARRPAPVQINWLGYPGTLGEDFIDYVIADPIVLPFDQQPHYVEKIVHLPDCYQVNDTKRIISDRVPSRGDAGLPDEGFVFCCFNNNYKITALMFDLWMRLLRAVDGSVLWLLRDNPGAERNLQGEAAARGVDPARLVFASRVLPPDHLARHRLADLFLDTLPYNAHTTASDALWVGLPVVTCSGSAFAGRVAASVLNAAGLPELVTHSLADYEGLALKLARNPDVLRSLRKKLQDNRHDCPLFDTNRFRCNLEAAYATMWEIAQQGESPRNFRVEAAP